MSIVCKDCGNTSEFYATAIEHRGWVVDGEKRFVRVLELYDTEVKDVLLCAKCRSDNLKGAD